MPVFIDVDAFYHLLWIGFGSLVIGLLFALCFGVIAQIVEQWCKRNDR